MGIKKPKLNEGETATYSANPYYDQVLLFADTKVPTSQDKYKLIDADKQLYEKLSKPNVDNFREEIRKRLTKNPKPWWPFVGKLYVDINIGGPKNYIEFKDLDNYLKTVFDAIKGIVIKDDHQIVRVTIDKQENQFTSGFTIAIHEVQQEANAYIYGQDVHNWENDRQLKISRGGICSMDAY
ncbi:RusA family crossover junction endodeoxyribonuclease [Cyclobacterium sp. SYSU L10401]|uniref:RusA family crossover junction endodeoxyribonuclease n=1 Tax=Cyclobacterium sp. SYSU L10401 TaxID=2678657 RepID=UPI0013D084F2|nr:RusA family crossover junction endodeoxyribonuclease [Cyclobacterium sp. SYSU L10401]